MQNTFITKIHIGKVRHLKNVDIVLSDTERKHLILTGKNGSGKTSVLEAMKRNIQFCQEPPKIDHASVKGKVLCLDNDIEKNIDISYSQSNIKFKDIFFSYIPAMRNKFTLPKAIESVDVKNKTGIADNKSSDFLKYILSLDYQFTEHRPTRTKSLKITC